MAADDLLGGVAEDPLGTGIPGLDQAVEAYVKDRVVYRSFDNEAVQSIIHPAIHRLETAAPAALKSFCSQAKWDGRKI